MKNEERLKRWNEDLLEENEQLKNDMINLYQRIFEMNEIIKSLDKNNAKYNKVFLDS